VSAAGQASAAVSAQVELELVSGEVLAPVLVPRLGVVPSSTTALGSAIVTDHCTTPRKCYYCTKSSHRNPSGGCSCRQLQGSEGSEGWVLSLGLDSVASVASVLVWEQL